MVMEPQQMQMTAGRGAENATLLEPSVDDQVAIEPGNPTRRPPIWAGLLLASVSVAVLLACTAAAAWEPWPTAAGPHLRSSKSLPGDASSHHSTAPLRMLYATAGGGAIAGAWMAVGAFIGKIFSALAGVTTNLCHSCGSLSTNICSALGRCGSDCCSGLGGALHSCPWCGDCLTNFWFGFGDLFGGCFHAVVAFGTKMYGLCEHCLNGCCHGVGTLGSDCCHSVGRCLNRLCPI